MTTKAKPFDLGELLAKGTRIEEIKILGPEDPEDKRLRRRIDFWSFVVKDLLAYLIAFLFVGAVGTYSFVILIKHGPASDEAQKVWPIVSGILTGIVGMVFGRATK